MPIFVDRRAGTACACPPCLPKSAVGGGSQWREAFILTIDGRSLFCYLTGSALERVLFFSYFSGS